VDPQTQFHQDVQPTGRANKANPQTQFHQDVQPTGRANKVDPQTHGRYSLKSEPIKKFSLEDSLVNFLLNGY